MRPATLNARWWGLLAVTVLAACSPPQTTSLADDPQVQAAQQELPFELALPRRLPEGWRLTKVEVERGPYGKGRVTAILYLSDTEGGIQVYEDQTFGMGTLANSTPIDVGNVAGQYEEHETTNEGTARSLLFLTPAGISVSMLSIRVEKETLLTIAESMLP